MKTGRHILITGDVGTGKSFLIRRLLAGCRCPVYGFTTVKTDNASKDGWDFYLFPAALPEKERIFSGDRLIGVRGKEKTAYPEVFDTLGVKLISEAKPGGVLVMDELGFMESEARLFRAAVLEALHGTIPVIAAVKKKYAVEFLDEVRACPSTVLYTLTPENRDTLADEIMRKEPLFSGI